MREVCAFCGKTLKLFDRTSLYCGNVRHPVCPDCWEKYQDTPDQERVEVLLKSGRARQPEEMARYCEEQKKRAKAVRETRTTELTCLRCGGPMLKYGRKLLQLGAEGLFGPVNREGLFSEWLTVDILRCEDCGRAEFFLDPPSQPSRAPEDPPPEPEAPPSPSPAPNSEPNRRRERESKPPWEK